MRRYAEALSVGSTQSGAAGLGHRRTSRLAVGLLVAAFGLLALAPTAPASILTRARTLSFGSDGSAASQFGNPSSLAFDQAADKLYVLDRVDFSSTLANLHGFSTPGVSPLGGAFPKSLAAPSFSAPIAVDSTAGLTAGHIFYVTNNTLYGFDSSGAALGGSFPATLPSGLYLGAAVDSAGNIYVPNADTGARNIRKYDSAGNFLTTISTSTLGGPGRIAFDSNNDLFFSITSLGGGQSGTYKATAASGYAQGSFTKIGSSTESPAGLAVDPATHTLYVVRSQGQLKRVDAYSAATGAFLYDFASGIKGSELSDIAVDQSADTVYVTDGVVSSTGNMLVHAFGPAQTYADATASPTAAKNVTDTSAEIGATITDNNVLPTNWRLEFSDNGGQSWTTVKSGRTANKSATIADTGPSTGTLSVKAAGSTFSLVFGAKTTTGIAYNASAATVKSALEALSTIGAGNVSVLNGPGSTSGSTPYTITFTGALAGTEVSKITADPTNLIAAPETVGATATGLDPNTDYKFRVITNKGSSPSTEVASAPISFHTLAPPPVITDVDAIQVQDSSARLVGTIDPRNADTGYVFEYGTTPALGSATAPVNIGGGTKEITVSQVVGGLGKNTTYYFRLVATNLTGTTASVSKTLHTRAVPFPPAGPSDCTNEAIRAAQASTFLPACRAYEMVSPVDKNQGSLPYAGFGNYAYMAVAQDGNSTAYLAKSQFADPPGQLTLYEAPYMSRRGPGGWSTSVPFPRYCPYDPPSNAQNGSQDVILSEEFDRAIVLRPESASCPFAPLDPAAPLGPEGSKTFNLYREDFGAGPAYDLLTPRLRDHALNFASSAYAGGSEDYSHIIYLGRENQTDPPDSPLEGNFTKLYEWIEEGEDGCVEPGGCLRLASVAPDDQPFTAPSLLPLPMSRLGNPPNPVSDDGERIYFQNQLVGESCYTAACQLYMREAGTTTFHVSASECTVDCGTDTSAAGLAWASPAGNIALFTSCDKLTDASAAPSGKPCGVDSNSGGVEVADQAKLYRWDRNAPSGHRLTDISVDHEPADGSQPRALDVIGASDDGGTIFFLTGGQIVAGGPSHSLLKIYRWRWNEGDPVVDYLGPYVSKSTFGGFEFTNKTRDEDLNFQKFMTRVTPDGSSLLLNTPVAMIPAADRDTHLDLYRWDEAAGWRCVSCQLPGQASAGHAEYWSVATNFQGGNSGIFSPRPSYSLTDDGRVFFSTPDALVAADVNGVGGCPKPPRPEGALENDAPAIYPCLDVYEWNDGTVSLVSSGSGDDPAIMVGASHDGRDVFFLTRQRLLAWDVDDQVDLYDARTGGGFPEPPPVPPSCEGEGCRGQGSSAPASSGAGTAVFEGPGNTQTKVTPRKCGKGRSRVTRKGKARCVKRKTRTANNNRRAAR